MSALESVHLVQALVEGGVRAFVQDPAAAAASLPATEVVPAEDDCPTGILIDPGDPGAPPPPPELEKTAESAAPADAKPATPEAPGVKLEVKLGGRSVSVPCTKDALWGYVAKAWLTGGFDAVIRARRAIAEAVSGFDAALNSRLGEARAAHGKVAENERLYDNGKHPIYAQDLDGWRKTASDNDREVRRAAAASGEAHAHIAQYDTLFREAWHKLAVIEEGLLCAWEKLGHEEFRTVMEENAKTAKSEWARYGCYLKDDKDKKPVDIEKATGSASDYRLQLKSPEPQGSGDGKQDSGQTQTKEPIQTTGPKGPLEGLLATAIHLKALAQGINATKAAVGKGVAHAGREGLNEAQQRDLRLRGIQDQIKAWSEAREKVRATDPVVASIYPQVWGGRTTIVGFQELIVTALLDAFQNSTVILAVENSHKLMSAGPLRVTPQDDGQDVTPTDPARLAALHVGDNWEAFTEFRLTIPASAVLTERLKVEENAKYSPWLHLPSRLRVCDRMQKNPAERKFNVPGSYECAAISHLFDWIERSRQSDKHAREVASRILMVEGLVLAPFTGGTSLILVGAVQAAFCGQEIYQALQEYGRESDLSRADLRRQLLPTEVRAIETALWTRPSLVDLVRTVTAKTLEAGLGVVPAERIPFVVGLALGELSGAIAPRDRVVVPQTAVTGTLPGKADK